MYRDLRVAVVVPAYNEERLVGTVIRTMPDLVDHIIVVDDASPDGTAEAARAVGDPRAVVITPRGEPGRRRRHPRPATGGRSSSGADVSVVMAGDAQMDPAYLPALLDPIADGDAQFTKANRFYGRGTFDGDAALPDLRQHRAVVPHQGRVRLLEPLRPAERLHRDPPRGARAAPWTGSRSATTSRTTCSINLNILRVPARDVPIPAVYGDEVSGIRLAHGRPRMVARLFRGFWHRIWWKYVLQSFSPVALLLFSGLALVAFGTAVGIFIILNTLGPPAASAGTVVLCVGPLLSGLQLLLFAMFLDIQEGSA